MDLLRYQTFAEGCTTFSTLRERGMNAPWVCWLLPAGRGKSTTPRSLATWVPWDPGLLQKRNNRQRAAYLLGLPFAGKIPWRREQLPISVFWPREFHGQKTLADYSPWGHNELDTAEQLSFHLAGKRNSNPHWYSCLENSMDRRTWCAAVHGVTKSRTWLRLNWVTNTFTFSLSFAST